MDRIRKHTRRSLTLISLSDITTVLELLIEKILDNTDLGTKTRLMTK